MAMIGNLNARDVAQNIDYTSKVLESAMECNQERWKVVKLSARTAALVTGNSVNLVPPHETILARKDIDGGPEFFVKNPKARPRQVLRKTCQVGIYENCEYVARIYRDKIVVTIPYVKWKENSGNYAERKERISNAEFMRTVQQAAILGKTERVWGLIGRSINDSYLCNADWQD